MNVFVEKLKEVLLSVLPITAIVLLLHFTITPLETPILIRFLIGATLIILGLTIFLCGIDLGISPVGNLIGSKLAKSNKIWIVVFAGLLLGFVISAAEPDLHILAGQVFSVTSGDISKLAIIIVVSIGIAIMLTIGLVRIIYNKSLRIVLAIFYALVLVLAFFTSSEFLAISFDASGATTGAMAVPFVLALAQGISSLKKDSHASENDSFGLVAITSIGAIIAVMFMSILTKTDHISGSIPRHTLETGGVISIFLDKFPTIAFEVLIALSPLFIIFLFLQIRTFHLTKKPLSRILKGFIYTFIGLILFLVGVNAGFMDVGTVLGHAIASFDNKVYLIIIGFVLGVVTILAEPAVYVLTHQIETVTSGYVKRKVVMIALSIGVGCAVALSMVRILIPQVQLWHFLLPGYLIAFAMTLIVPDLFVGMAFDSGGVASGPMTATFVLAFAQGAADAIEGADVLVDGFGIIALVALTPLIALQAMGILFKIKAKKEAT